MRGVEAVRAVVALQSEGADIQRGMDISIQMLWSDGMEKGSGVGSTPS